MAQRTSGQILELGCHGEDGVQTAVADNGSHMLAGPQSGHKYPAEATISVQCHRPPLTNGADGLT